MVRTPPLFSTLGSCGLMAAFSPAASQTVEARYADEARELAGTDGVI